MTDKAPKRDDIERELVVKDKQALISHCLKLYDTNRHLLSVIKDREKEIQRKDTKMHDMLRNINELRKLKWYNMIFK